MACPVDKATYGMWRWMNGNTVINCWCYIEVRYPLVVMTMAGVTSDDSM